MIKRKFLKSYMLLLFLLVLSPMTKEEIMAVEIKKEDELKSITKDYMRNSPFIEIGPDWGEDRIVVKEIYDKYRKEKEEKEEGEYDNFAFTNTDPWYILPTTSPFVEGRLRTFT